MLGKFFLKFSSKCWKTFLPCWSTWPCSATTISIRSWEEKILKGFKKLRSPLLSFRWILREHRVEDGGGREKGLFLGRAPLGHLPSITLVRIDHLKASSAFVSLSNCDLPSSTHSAQESSLISIVWTNNRRLLFEPEKDHFWQLPIRTIFALSYKCLMNLNLAAI